MEKRNWRLIVSADAPAAWNMAVDEALFDSYASGNSLPVLRFYGWSPAAVSFGRFQDTSDIIKLPEVDYVRRMTGGAAILHDNELTYSLVCCKEDIPGINNVNQSYDILVNFICEGYRSLGLAPEYVKNNKIMKEQRLNSKEKSNICFEGLELCDVIIDNKKIGGNAQMRRSAVLFQHGSIPLSLNSSLSELVFGKNKNSVQYATSLQDLAIQTDKKSVLDLLQKSFKKSFNVCFTKKNLSDTELCLAKKLEIEKYKNNEWIWHRKQSI